MIQGVEGRIIPGRADCPTTLPTRVYFLQTHVCQRQQIPKFQSSDIAAAASPNLWELGTEMVSDRAMLSSLPPEATRKCFRLEGKLSAPLSTPNLP